MAKKSVRRTTKTKKKTGSSKKKATRFESDSMGTMAIPADAIYGASTARAVRNFPVAKRPLPYEVVRAFLLLKALHYGMSCLFLVSTLTAALVDAP